MKAMKKQEMADAAGVSVKTLMKWCRPFRDDLEQMGLKPRAKKLPPYVVAYLAEKFCIDL